MKSWIDELPLAPMSFLIQVQMEEFDNLSRITGEKARLQKFDDELRKLVDKSKREIAKAKTRDDVTTAKERLALFQSEQKRIRDRIIMSLSKMLLTARYICVGYLDGKKQIIPACAWSGETDWEKGTLVFERRKYLHVSVVEGWRVRPEHKEKLHAAAQDKYNQDAPKTGAVGRPSSMPIVFAEFERRRANKSVADSLAAEAAYLEKWIKKYHPNEKPLTAKTIANKIRDSFRTYQKKSA